MDFEAAAGIGAGGATMADVTAIMFRLRPFRFRLEDIIRREAAAMAGGG